MHVTASACPAWGESWDETLARAAAGDPEALAELVAPLLPRLTGYLTAMAGDDGEDLVNDVMVRVLRNVSGFDGGEDSFRSWVFTIAHHLAVDHRRRRRRREHDELPEELAAPIAGATESIALSNLAGEELRAVLRLLRPSYRQVLLLRVVADLDVEQTAAAMGKRPGTVRVLQHRALEAVRKKIAPRV